MEQSWGLTEIVSAITANLVLDEAKASAVALARCCKSLEEPVLCEVWRTLDSLAPLVKCLPPEVWVIKDGKLCFKRAPFRAEWSRFQQQYASKVRNLVVSSSDYAVISSAVFQLLQLYSHCNPVLPNLVSLTWESEGNDASVPFISSFISPSLTSITIKVHQRASPMLPLILARLSAISPNISEIEVQRLKYEPSMEEASSQLLMQCNPHCLRKYNVDAPLSAAALSYIIQLPSLRELWLVGPFHFPDPLPTVVFPSLRSLDVEFDGNLSWLELLPAIESPVLSEITVECPGPDMLRFMEAFQVTLAAHGIHEHLREFTVRCEDAFEITPQILAGNLSFKNLTSLRFLSSCSTFCQTSDLTDEDIDLLTNAMPGLKTLAISERPCDIPSKITLKSLYALSSRCTELTDLQIHFNPNSFVTNVNTGSDSGDVGLSYLKTPSSELCSVKTIDVGHISLPRQTNLSYIMALGLLGVFPHLEEVEYKDWAWREIDDLIKVCRRIYPALP